MEFDQEDSLFQKFIKARKILLLKDVDSVNAALQPIVEKGLAADAESWEILGIDGEWKPFNSGDAPNPTALLQLSTGDTVYLIRLIDMEVLPETVRIILQSKHWLKCGVASAFDVEKLATEYGGFKSYGVLDLAWLVRHCQFNTVKSSLQECVELVFQETIPKPRNVTMSNWELAELSPAQLEYAALDAVVSYEAIWKLLPMCYGDRLPSVTLSTLLARFQDGIDIHSPTGHFINRILQIERPRTYFDHEELDVGRMVRMQFSDGRFMGYATRDVCTTHLELNSGHYVQQEPQPRFAIYHPFDTYTYINSDHCQYCGVAGNLNQLYIIPRDIARAVYLYIYEHQGVVTQDVTPVGINLSTAAKPSKRKAPEAKKVKADPESTVAGTIQWRQEFDRMRNICPHCRTKLNQHMNGFLVDLAGDTQFCGTIPASVLGDRTPPVYVGALGSTTLKERPEKTLGEFRKARNAIRSLKYAPSSHTDEMLQTHRAVVNSWFDVPEDTAIPAEQVEEYFTYFQEFHDRLVQDGYIVSIPSISLTAWIVSHLLFTSTSSSSTSISTSSSCSTSDPQELTQEHVDSFLGRWLNRELELKSSIPYPKPDLSIAVTFNESNL